MKKNTPIQLKKAQLWLCFFLTLSVSVLRAEPTDPRIDSLLNYLEHAPDDTDKVNTMDRLFSLMLFTDKKQAEKYAKAELALALKLNYPKGIGAGYGNIGNCNSMAGDYVAAMENFIKAMKIFEANGNKKKLAQYMGNMGDINLRQNRLEDALKYHEKSLELKKQIGNTNEMAYNYQSLASINYMQGNFKGAMENYDKALQIGVASGNKYIQASAYNGIAAIAFKQKNYQTSLEGYKKALEVLKTSGDYGKGFAGIYYNMGKAYRLMGDYKKAVQALDTSLFIAKNIGALEDIKKAYSELDFTYNEMGELEKAYEALQWYSVYKDSLIEINNQKVLNELQEKYETEKKDKEIFRLNTEKEALHSKTILQNFLLIASGGIILLIIVVVMLYVRQRKIKEQQKRVELEQQALRAQMNPHFIFNSLNSIHRLFIEGKEDMANDYMGDFGELLRHILENSGKTAISLHDELSTLKLYLDLENIRTDGIIDYHISIDDTIDQLNNYVPPLIIQPFVENSIWHGILPTEQKGMIEIEIRKKNAKCLICTITDNGIGIEKSKKLKEKEGGHRSKGMQITSERLKVENAVQAEQLPSGGTRITLLIPLNR